MTEPIFWGILCIDLWIMSTFGFLIMNILRGAVQGFDPQMTLFEEYNFRVGNFLMVAPGMMFAYGFSFATIPPDPLILSKLVFGGYITLTILAILPPVQNFIERFLTRTDDYASVLVMEELEK